MTKKSASPQRLTVKVPLIALGVLAIASSFTLGVKTAGDVKTIAPMEAQNAGVTGDVNGDGKTDIHDAIVILEVARGYQHATADELRADPNGDGQLTIDDAIRILSDLSIR